MLKGDTVRGKNEEGEIKEGIVYSVSTLMSSIMICNYGCSILRYDKKDEFITGLLWDFNAVKSSKFLLLEKNIFINDL